MKMRFQYFVATSLWLNEEVNKSLFEPKGQETWYFSLLVELASNNPLLRKEGIS